jgi:hypothetical protein
MDKQIYLTLLYDIYSSLLTEKQQQYFEDYYFENLSLKEISENYKVSRNAIYNTLKEVEEKLQYYENKLNIHKKNKRLKEIVTEISDQKIKKQIEELL